MAGRCHVEAEPATSTMPTSNTEYAGDSPMMSQPMPKPPMEAASTRPQWRRSRSTKIPPGSVTRPEAISRVVLMAPTPTSLSRKVSCTSGSMTWKPWRHQWKTPWPADRSDTTKPEESRTPGDFTAASAIDTPHPFDKSDFIETLDASELRASSMTRRSGSQASPPSAPLRAGSSGEGTMRTMPSPCRPCAGRPPTRPP